MVSDGWAMVFEQNIMEVMLQFVFFADKKQRRAIEKKARERDTYFLHQGPPSYLSPVLRIPSYHEPNKGLIIRQARDPSSEYL